MKSAPPKTAFVFAGGGSLGAIQVGALRELIRAGHMPDLLVGASVGALNAVFFAGRPTLEGIADLERIWVHLRRRDVFPVSIANAARWVMGKGSLFEPHSLRRLIEQNLKWRRLEDSPIPIHVLATNLNGAAVRLSSGEAVDAVLASAAIPIAFPAVRIGDDHLMDGAISGNTPILEAAALGAERIIVLQTGYACSLAEPPSGSIARGMHALTLLIANQMERDLRLLGGGVEVHVTPHLCPLDVSPFNFEHSARLIERSAAITRAWLETGALGQTPDLSDIPHRHPGELFCTHDHPYPVHDKAEAKLA